MNDFLRHTIHNCIWPILTYVMEYKQGYVLTLFRVLLAMGLDISPISTVYNSGGYSQNSNIHNYVCFWDWKFVMFEISYTLDIIELCSNWPFYTISPTMPSLLLCSVLCLTVQDAMQSAYPFTDNMAMCDVWRLGHIQLYRFPLSRIVFTNCDSQMFLLWYKYLVFPNQRIPIALKNSNCCFSKYFGYYSCMTVLPMLIQRMQWTSGCKIFTV